MSRFRVRLELLIACLALTTSAPPSFPAPGSTADSIRYASRVTSNNCIAATLTNYGVLGNNFVSRDSSLVYPVGTGFEHLVHGGLWIGAQAVDSTGAFVGVATACLDSPPGAATSGLTEFTPTGIDIQVLSSLPTDRFYSPFAMSEQDLIASSNDLTVKRTSSNPEEHRPMGLLVRQESHSWSWESLRDVLFLHFTITNIGAQPLTNVWVGLYTELASGPQNSYSCWPPSSSCSTIGGWYSKKWLQYEDSLRMVREHYRFTQPVPGGCVLSRVPCWMGVQLLTRLQMSIPQQLTLAAWPYGPADASRDQDVERYALMSAGTIQDLTAPGLMPQTGDPVELLALGPFETIAASDSIEVDFALVGGSDEAEIHRHAIIAQRVYDTGYSMAVTPALLALVSALAEPGHVRLVWQGAEGAAPAAMVERREATDEWTPIAEANADGLGRITYDDTRVVGDHRYGYRLAVRNAGSVDFAGETWVEVPLAAKLALHGVRPNPSARGTPEVALTLADGSPASLEVFDLSGRRVWSRRLVGLGVGSHVEPITAALAPGVYVVRLAQGGRVTSVRAVVMK